MDWIGRAVDRLASRGEGLDAMGDPFGPPLAAADAERLLAVVRSARLDAGKNAPLPMPDGGAAMDIVLRPPRSGHAWVVLAPPYGTFGRAGRFGVYAAHPAALAARGFGVAAFGLPYHGARAMRGYPSGWGFVRADLAHTARAVIASAAEAAAIARWLREERGATRVVGLGMSLGGPAIGLAAAMHDPHAATWNGAQPAPLFDRLAFLAAVDSCAAFFETGQNREARRRTLRGAGFGPREVEDSFRPVAPSTYAAPEGVPRLFAIPDDDLVVPSSTQRAWCDAWKGEKLDLGWRGHALGLTDPAIARAIAVWLARE